MSLSDTQSIFAKKISILMLVAQEMGYGVTCGDFYRDARCHYGHHASLHRKRLAADLNLFKDGEYLTDGRGHRELSMIWVLMGGNPPIAGDANHYSFGGEERIR